MTSGDRNQSQANAPSTAPELSNVPIQESTSSTDASAAIGIPRGENAKVKGSMYRVTDDASVMLSKAKNVKSFTVPKAVVINGKKYLVTGIGAKAFAKAKKCKTLTVKAGDLTRASIKNCLKGSKVKTVKIKVASKKAKKSQAKWFASKKIVGKKVRVK